MWVFVMLMKAGSMSMYLESRGVPMALHNTNTYWRQKQSKVRINSLWPSDGISRHRSGLTVAAEVMARCLTASSHYLNQCWFINHGVLWHGPESKFIGSTVFKNSIHILIWKITFFKSSPHLPETNELTHWGLTDGTVISNLEFNDWYHVNFPCKCYV